MVKLVITRIRGTDTMFLYTTSRHYLNPVKALRDAALIDDDVEVVVKVVDLYPDPPLGFVGSVCVEKRGWLVQKMEEV